jgi:hypothetical protein
MSFSIKISLELNLIEAKIAEENLYCKECCFPHVKKSDGKITRFFIKTD